MAGESIISGSNAVKVYELLTSSVETSQGGAAPVYHQIGPVFRDLGPYLQDIVPHLELLDKTANFDVRLRAEKSYNGVNWAAFSALVLPTVSANGYSIGAAYTTRTDFGRHIRFMLGVSDAGAMEQGTVSVTVALRFWES